MNIKKNIRSLRIIAFLLFLVPALGLIGSLLIHNFLVTFKFSHGLDYKFKSDKIGETIEILCSEENDFCLNNTKPFEFNKKLNNCNKYVIDGYWVNELDEKLEIEQKEIVDYGKKIFIKFERTNQLNETCILNSNLLNFYNITPPLFENIYNFKTNPNTKLGTEFAVNPLIYGETSISNIVKRVPINFIFKPLLFVSVILMLFYWILFNKILNNLLNIKKINYFYIFGILSAIFLFLHVFFLGWTFESNFLTKMRRIYIVFFILFEVLAQAFLINRIVRNKDLIKEYLNLNIVYSKLIFVITVCVSTITILIILIFKDLSNEVDYILEWNYFLLLLIFYLLSSLMWKRLIYSTAH